MADRQDLLAGESMSRAYEILNGSYYLLNKLLPGLEPVPTEFRELCNCLEKGRFIGGLEPGRQLLHECIVHKLQ